MKYVYISLLLCIVNIGIAMESEPRDQESCDIDIQYSSRRPIFRASQESASCWNDAIRDLIAASTDTAHNPTVTKLIISYFKKQKMGLRFETSEHSWDIANNLSCSEAMQAIQEFSQKHNKAKHTYVPPLPGATTISMAMKNEQHNENHYGVNIHYADGKILWITSQKSVACWDDAIRDLIRVSVSTADRSAVRKLFISCFKKRNMELGFETSKHSWDIITNLSCLEAREVIQDFSHKYNR